MKCKYYIEKDWEDAYSPEKPASPEYGSDDTMDDEDFSVARDDEILEMQGLLQLPYVYQ